MARRPALERFSIRPDRVLILRPRPSRQRLVDAIDRTWVTLGGLFHHWCKSDDGLLRQTSDLTEKQKKIAQKIGRHASRAERASQDHLEERKWQAFTSDA